ncbi:MAG: RNA-binding S4 domain-containing protein [Metamycoplasmataceae bacterium]
MKVEIKGKYIKLGQLIKKLNLIDTGGQAKDFIENSNIKIDNEKPKGRSTKVFVGSTVWIDDEVYMIINSTEQ